MKRVALLLSVVFFAPLLATAFLVASSSEANAAVDVVCFNDLFQRKIGEPRHESNIFPGIKGPATVKVYNGDGSGWLDRATVANVIINGKVIFRASDFNKKVKYLEAKVNLLAGNNSIDVNLLGMPGVRIRVEVVQKAEADAAKFIGSEGGEIEVLNTSSSISGTKIIVSENTFDDPQLIMVSPAKLVATLPEGVSAAGPGIDIKCTQYDDFKYPIGISLPIEIMPEEFEYIDLLYFNEEMQTWETIKSVFDFKNRKILFLVNHFSIYQAVIKRIPGAGNQIFSQFNFNTDVFEFDNVGGRCYGMSHYATWFYNYKGHGLRCRYNYADGKLVASRINLLDYENWATIEGFFNATVGLFTIAFTDSTALKIDLIKILESGKVINIEMLGHMGIIPIGHSIVVIGWTPTSSNGEGYFTCYDVSYPHGSPVRIYATIHDEPIYDPTGIFVLYTYRATYFSVDNPNTDWVDPPPQYNLFYSMSTPNDLNTALQVYADIPQSNGWSCSGEPGKNWSSAIDLITPETYSTGSNFREIGDTSIAVDPNGNYHVVYAQDLVGIRYLNSSQSVQTIVPVSSSVDVFSPSIAIDTSGVIHLIYQEWTSSGSSYTMKIKYRKKSGGSWSSAIDLITPETYSTGSNFREIGDTSIAVDPNGNYHVVYAQDLVGIRYLNSSQSVQTIVPVSSSVDVFSPSIAIDTSGVIHLIYQEWTSSGSSYTMKIKYRKKSGGSWSSAIDLITPETYSTGSNFREIGDTSIAVDPNGNYHVVYAQDLVGIRYLNSSQSVQTIVPVSSSVDVFSPSIAIDTSGVIHLIYQEWTSSESSYTMKIKYRNK